MQGSQRRPLQSCAGAYHQHSVEEPSARSPADAGQGDREMGFAGSRAVDEDDVTGLPRFIDQVYNAVCRHSTIGSISHVEFERTIGLA
jgi:hypothetical protein